MTSYSQDTEAQPQRITSHRIDPQSLFGDDPALVQPKAAKSPTPNSTPTATSQKNGPKTLPSRKTATTKPKKPLTPPSPSLMSSKPPKPSHKARQTSLVTAERCYKAYPEQNTDVIPTTKQLEARWSPQARAGFDPVNDASILAFSSPSPKAKLSARRQSKDPPQLRDAALEGGGSEASQPSPAPKRRTSIKVSELVETDSLRFGGVVERYH